MRIFTYYLRCRPIVPYWVRECPNSRAVPFRVHGRSALQVQGQYTFVLKCPPLCLTEFVDALTIEECPGISTTGVPFKGTTHLCLTEFVSALTIEECRDGYTKGVPFAQDPPSEKTAVVPS